METTGAQAGLSGIDQIALAARCITRLGRPARISEIYSAVEAHMAPHTLSAAGRSSLRFFVNEVAVEKGYIHPHDPSKPGWRLTALGYELADLHVLPEIRGGQLDPVAMPPESSPERPARGMVEIHAVVATTHKIEPYGIAVDRTFLESLAARLLADQAPLHLQHDSRERIATRVIRAWVEEGPDGESELRAVYEIDEEDYPRVQSLRGMSIAFTSLVARPEPGDPNPGIRIAADAFHFDEDQLSSARAALSGTFAVETRVLYQWAAEPPAKVVLELLSDSVALGLLTNALYDALKVFLRRVNGKASRTVFEIRHARSGTTARIETSSDDHLKRALKTIDVALTSGKDSEYDVGNSEWD